jgi:hypothetical protein
MRFPLLMGDDRAYLVFWAVFCNNIFEGIFNLLIGFL